MKNDDYISKFMPDYPKGQLPEKEFFYRVVCSIYPQQMFNMIYAAQRKRAVTAEDNRYNKIELTPEIADEIDKIVLLPSKILCL